MSWISLAPTFKNQTCKDQSENSELSNEADQSQNQIKEPNRRLKRTFNKAFMEVNEDEFIRNINSNCSHSQGHHHRHKAGLQTVRHR